MVLSFHGTGSPIFPLSCEPGALSYNAAGLGPLFSLLEKMLPLLSPLLPHPVHSFLLSSLEPLSLWTCLQIGNRPHCHTDTTTTPGAQNGEVERI